MATAEIPPTELRPESYPGMTDAEAPVLLVQLQDDLARSRIREAFWISVVVHLLAVSALALSPNWIAVRPIYVMTAADLLKNKELTYLEAPPDEQKVTKRPDTNIVSDKDRIATTTKAPTIDRETLQKLLDARRPGPPGAPGPALPPSPPAAAQAPATGQQPGPQAPAQSQEQGQIAKLE